jgi:tRNA(Arg) A34 adenosine deaminase TadA
VPAAHDYFSMLCERARRAGEAGDYAIGAALSVTSAEGELIVFGVNTLFSERNPSGHAEMGAIMRAHAIARAAPDQRADLIRTEDVVVRPAAGSPPTSVLFTTLEPCPMCTVAIVNAGIERVVIASEDPPSGTLEHDRLERLPAIWSHLAQRLDVVWAQSEDSSDTATYLPAELRAELLGRFEDSRQQLDDSLLERGALNFDALRDAIRASAADPRASAADGP